MADKSLAILQARMSSTRLPGKVLANINGEPMIFWQIERVKKARKIDELIVATSTDQSDNQLAEYLEKKGFLVERGPIDNVLERFLQIIEQYKEYKTIVRLTGDCPMVMPALLDEMITKFENSNSDYLSNALDPTFPDGLDIEICRHSALTRLGRYDLTDVEREHVTLGMRNRTSEFTIENFSQEIDHSELRWTVDYPEDFDFVRKIYAEFEGQESIFSYEDLLKLLSAKPELNNKISGNLRNVALKEIVE